MSEEIREKEEVAAVAVAHALPVEVALRPLEEWPRPLGEAPLRGASAPARRDWGGAILFGVGVLLPVAIAAVYLFLIAAPRFASEASFIVRSASAGSSGVSALMASKGLSRAVDDSFAVNEYLTSPDVVAKLAAHSGLREVLSRPEADMFNRYPGPFTRDNSEALRRRFEEMVTQSVDEASGINRIEVVAFRPEDAQAIAGALLALAEEMVNRLNERAYRDALATSNRTVDAAMTALRGAEAALTAYRDAEGTVDPASDAAATLKVLQTLAVNYSKLQASIMEQEAVAPRSPQSAALRQRAEAVRDEMDKLRQKIAGGGASAADKIGRYEELALRRELAAKSLENAVAGRERARENAESQHLYVQVIRAPSLADVARYPRAWLDLGAVAGLALMVYFVLRSLAGTMREHRV